MRVLAISAAVALALGVADAKTYPSQISTKIGPIFDAGTQLSETNADIFCGLPGNDAACIVTGSTKAKLASKTATAVTAGNLLGKSLAAPAQVLANAGTVGALTSAAIANLASTSGTTKFSTSYNRVVSYTASSATVYLAVKMIVKATGAAGGVQLVKQTGSAETALVGCSDNNADAAVNLAGAANGATAKAWANDCSGADKASLNWQTATDGPILSLASDGSTNFLFGTENQLVIQYTLDSTSPNGFLYQLTDAAADPGIIGTAGSAARKLRSATGAISIKGTSSTLKSFLVLDGGSFCFRKFDAVATSTSSANSAQQVASPVLIGQQGSSTTLAAAGATAGTSGVATSTSTHVMVKLVSPKAGATTSDGLDVYVVDADTTSKSYHCTMTSALTTAKMCYSVGSNTGAAVKDIGVLTLTGSISLNARSHGVVVSGATADKVDWFNAHYSVSETRRITPVPPPPPTTTLPKMSSTTGGTTGGTGGTTGNGSTSNTTTTTDDGSTSASAPLVASVWAMVGVVAALIAA